MLKGINKKDVATLKEPADYAALCKLAVDYSDGVIQNSEHINEDIMDYARQSGKLVLDYQTPDVTQVLATSFTTRCGKLNKNKIRIKIRRS